MGRLRRSLGASLVATLGAGLLVGLQASPASAAVSLSGARMWAPNTSYTGSADTAEKINAIVKSGDVLYVGGSFSQLRPEPGAGVPSLAQPNLYAVDTRTGAYLPAFRPVVNGMVEALEVDAATGTLFVGGRFTQVNGQANAGFAILDAATGQLKPGITQRPVNKGGATPGVVMGIKRVGRQLYVAGDFVNIGAAQRGNLARLDIDAGLTPDPFQAFIAGMVRAVDVDPANPGRIYIGGEFSGVRESAGGATLAGTRWLAALQTSGPSTGLPDASFIPNVPCDTDPVCTNPTRGRRVVARNGLVYVAFGGGSGRFGIYNQSTGLNLRMLRADGDVQTVALIGDRVYVGGHFTRIFGGETRCQLFSVLAASPWSVQADPNFDNGSHLGVFEVAGDAGGDVFAAGHLVSPNTAASPACNLGNSTATYNHIVRLSPTPANDTTAPSVPAVNVAPSPFTAANVSWSPSSDASGVSTYYLYVNGVRTEALSGAQTFRALGGLNPRTSYTVQVQALDQFGNRSALSAPVSFVTGSPPPALPNPLRAFGQFFPTATPARILDTRVGIGGISGPLTGGAPVRFPVLGVGGVPATGVQSVVLNMTVAEPTQGGFVTIYPTGEARPTASNLNFAAGETVPNLVQARVGVDGTVEAFLNAGSSHLIADVVGWFASNAETRPGSRIEPQSPERVLDTRPATRVGPHGPVGRGQAIEVQVVPAGQGYTGVVLNLTGTEPTSSTYVTAFPGHAGQSARGLEPQPPTGRDPAQPGDGRGVAPGHHQAVQLPGLDAAHRRRGGALPRHHRPRRQPGRSGARARRPDPPGRHPDHAWRARSGPALARGPSAPSRARCPRASACRGWS